MKVRSIVNWVKAPSPYKSFQEFWPHYLKLHKEPLVLREHERGTTSGLVSGALTSTLGGIGAVAIEMSELLILVPAVFGAVHAAVTYAILIPSHEKYGKNKAATLESLKHAWWSIRGDHKMWMYKKRGWLDEEFKKLGIQVPTK